MHSVNTIYAVERLCVKKRVLLSQTLNLRPVGYFVES